MASELDPTWLVQLHRSRDLHADCMRKVFGAKNIDQVYATLPSLGEEITIDEYCFQFDRRKAQWPVSNGICGKDAPVASPPRRSGRAVSTDPILVTTERLASFCSHSPPGDSSPDSHPPHEGMWGDLLDSLGSLSVDSTQSGPRPVTCPAGPVASSSSTSTPSSSSSSSSSSACATASMSFAPSRQPVIAKRDPTIERMIQAHSPNVKNQGHSTPFAPSSLAVGHHNPLGASAGWRADGPRGDRPAPLPPSAVLSPIGGPADILSPPIPATTAASRNLRFTATFPATRTASQPAPPAVGSGPSGLGASPAAGATTLRMTEEERRAKHLQALQHIAELLGCQV